MWRWDIQVTDEDTRHRVQVHACSRYHAAKFVKIKYPDYRVLVVNKTPKLKGKCVFCEKELK